MYNPDTVEEKLFLSEYNPDEYERPSLTVDIAIFTLDENNELSVLLVKRDNFPYKGYWAIPGGFLDLNLSVDDFAKEELYKKTGLEHIAIEQFGTFGDVDRDPRTRVISVSYMAFIPKNHLTARAGFNTSDAQIFRITSDSDGLVFMGERTVVKEKDLAFDHAVIIKTAIGRLRNRIDYTKDAFAFLMDDQFFSIHELKRIYETVKGQKLDTPNFRRDFVRKYVSTGFVESTGQKMNLNGKRAAEMYRVVRAEEERESYDLS